MKTIDIELQNIIPYKRNNKIHSNEQIEQIAKSIQEFGFLNPILIDEEYIILAGHGRRMAAKKLKLKKVPCIQHFDLTYEQKEKYRLLDNRLADLSEYNIENVKDILEELKDEFLNDLFSDLRKSREPEEFENKEIDKDKLFKDKTITCPSCGFTFEEGKE